MTKEEASLALLDLCDGDSAMIPYGYADNHLSKVYQSFNKELSALKQQVAYWKLSFQKQVEASHVQWKSLHLN